VIGRMMPKAKMRMPPIYQMRIFACDQPQAKSRFWYYASMLRKVKKTQGEILCCSQVAQACFTWCDHGTLYMCHFLLCVIRPSRIKYMIDVNLPFIFVVTPTFQQCPTYRRFHSNLLIVVKFCS